MAHIHPWRLSWKAIFVLFVALLTGQIAIAADGFVGDGASRFEGDVIAARPIKLISVDSGTVQVSSGSAEVDVATPPDSLVRFAEYVVGETDPRKVVTLSFGHSVVRFEVSEAETNGVRFFQSRSETSGQPLNIRGRVAVASFGSPRQKTQNVPCLSYCGLAVECPSTQQVVVEETDVRSSMDIDLSDPITKVSVASFHSEPRAETRFHIVKEITRCE